MNNIALIFPGQGAQFSGMGKDLYDNSLKAKFVFDSANDILGFDITDMCFNASGEVLMKTINSQPAIVTVEIAAFEALKELLDVKFIASAGHSLGEYSALYAAGALDLTSVLKLIQKRAELMNNAAESSDGAMAAVIGLDSDKVTQITKNIDNVFVANYNSPIQIVITGDKLAINNSIEVFKNAGAKKVIPLSVSGAFHSPFMKHSADLFSEFSSTFDFSNTSVPVYTNVDAMPESDGNVLKNKLPRQIFSSVYWYQTINNMVDNGIQNFIEIGPGKILSGLNKKIVPQHNTLNIFDWDSLLNTVNELKEKELV